MDELVCKIRGTDVFEASELREIIDQFTNCLNSHLQKDQQNTSLAVSSSSSSSLSSVTEFTAVCTEIFVSLRSQIQYLSDIATSVDVDVELSSQSDAAKSNEVNELLVKLWSPLLHFVKHYATPDHILSVHASTLTQCLLDSLAPYLAVFQNSSLLNFSSTGVALVDWAVVFPLVSRLGCVLVFWHQTIASDTLASLYSTLAFFKGYFNLLQFALNQSNVQDPELTALVAKFDGIFAKIHTKSNSSSTTSRLIPLRMCVTECLLSGPGSAHPRTPIASVLRHVPKEVSYPFQLVGLLMWLLCELCSFELPLQTSIAMRPALQIYLSFLTLWVHTLGEYCSLGSTLVSDAWAFDLLDTVARDVVSRVRALTSSQLASVLNPLLVDVSMPSMTQYSTQSQSQALLQQQQHFNVRLILKSLLRTALGKSIEGSAGDTLDDTVGDMNLSSVPTTSSNSPSACVPAQYILSAVLRQCDATTQQGILTAVLKAFMSQSASSSSGQADSDSAATIAGCFANLLRVAHKDVVLHSVREVMLLLSVCASPTGDPAATQQIEREYGVRVSQYTASDATAHLEELLLRLPISALFARKDPEVFAALRVVLRSLSQSIQAYSPGQASAKTGVQVDTGKRLHSEMSNSPSQMQISVASAISLLLNTSSDELIRTGITKDRQSTPPSDGVSILQSEHTASAVKLFQLISTSMKYFKVHHSPSVAVADLRRLDRLVKTVTRLARPLRAVYRARMPPDAAVNLLEFSHAMIQQAVRLWDEIAPFLRVSTLDDMAKNIQNNSGSGSGSGSVQCQRLHGACDACVECACELLLTAAGADKLWSTAPVAGSGGASDLEARYAQLSGVVSKLCTLALGVYSIAPRASASVLSNRAVRLEWKFCSRINTQCSSAVLDLLNTLPDSWKARLKQILPIEMAPHIKSLVQRRAKGPTQVPTAHDSNTHAQVKSQLQVALFIRLQENVSC